MVSIRCKMIVKCELEYMNLHCTNIILGEAEIIEDLGSSQWNELDANLRIFGIELMENKKSILIEKIKHIIIENVHYQNDVNKINLSERISSVLGYDYTYLANLFTTYHQLTIEQYYIHHKIERIKELLNYDEINISEIAIKLHYSSVAHLSNQFKKMTGLTPSSFKKLNLRPRIGLEEI